MALQIDIIAFVWGRSLTSSSSSLPSSLAYLCILYIETCVSAFEYSIKSTKEIKIWFLKFHGHQVPPKGMQISILFSEGIYRRSEALKFSKSVMCVTLLANSLIFFQICCAVPLTLSIRDSIRLNPILVWKKNNKNILISSVTNCLNSFPFLYFSLYLIH